MTLSTYEQPLPEDRWGEAATGYRSDGNEVAGKWHTYPEMAAAGLWTTPTDLAHWAIAVQRAYDGKSGGFLAEAMARQMLEPDMNGWGLGPAIQPSGTFFHHSGGNEGFRCRLIAFVKGGRGIAVMTNSDAGDDLYEQIIGTLAAAYDWPELKPEEKVVVEIDPARLPDYLGRYELSFGSIAITLEDGHLWLEPEWSERPEELLSEGDDRFLSRSDGAELTFMREGGDVVAFEVYGMRAERVQ
jgi:CubicO group peptidase (beta-lactamase class C family)